MKNAGTARTARILNTEYADWRTVKHPSPPDQWSTVETPSIGRLNHLLVIVLYPLHGRFVVLAMAAGVGMSGKAAVPADTGLGSVVHATASRPGT